MGLFGNGAPAGKKRRGLLGDIAGALGSIGEQAPVAMAYFNGDYEGAARASRFAEEARSDRRKAELQRQQLEAGFGSLLR